MAEAKQMEVPQEMRSSSPRTSTRLAGVQTALDATSKAQDMMKNLIPEIRQWKD